MVRASRVHRLAGLRKRQHTTRVQVAGAMGVTQARVSRIEKGRLERSEVDTLATTSSVDRRLKVDDAAPPRYQGWSTLASARESAVRGFYPLGSTART
ncbi:helix-turn-helix domain-containing protein [Streptomyces sp. NPDC008092]|uniref:helix-turn-helix domain-containing protein n=1 Tax=Streptomyces sp. NPDC008092 TaxID=3364808 RepID=UPI0036E42514